METARMPAPMTITLLIVIITTIIELSSAHCTVHLDEEISENSPILIKNNDVLNSDHNSSELVIRNGDSFEILCSGPNNWIVSSGSGFEKQALETVTCNNRHFEYAGNSLNFAEIACRKQPESKARHVGRCNASGKLIEIGIEIETNRFVQKILLCFDERTSRTYWTKNYLKSRGYYWKNKGYKRFENDYFLNVDPYVAYKENRHLDKGHLSAKGDFYTSTEKRLTYYYLNVAPQIKKFNNENWRKLEELIREVAHERKRDFIVYTGTHESAGFLKNDQIPIPLYFWKVIIDPSTGKGISFIGTNDVNEVYSPICTDVCSRLSWLNDFQEERTNWRFGFVYCCTIDDFKGVHSLIHPDFSEYKNAVLYD